MPTRRASGSRSVYSSGLNLFVLGTAALLLSSCLAVAVAAAPDASGNGRAGEGKPVRPDQVSGRPILIRNTSIELAPAPSSASTGTNFPDFRQYLIHTDAGAAASVADKIKEAAQGHALQYLPEVKRVTNFSKTWFLDMVTGLQP